MSKGQPETTTKDGCPAWADEQIAYLRQVEIHLGHIPQSPEWQSEHVAQITKRTFSKDILPLSEDTAELLFKKVSQRLVKEGFSFAEIAGFFNKRISYPKGPAYCNEDEVKAATPSNQP